MAKKMLEVQKVVTLLETMEETTLGKQIEFNEVESVEDALKVLGGNQARLLSVINAGLEEEQKSAARKNVDGWHTYKLNAEGDPTDELNGIFNGDIVDSKKVGAMVLNFAKMFGYSTIKDRDRRRKIKADAAQKVKAIILADPEMKKAVSDVSDEVTEVTETEEATA